MEKISKPDPIIYVKVLEIFLDRMTVKKIIPIEYENAINEVKFDMVGMFDDEENKKAFESVIKNFEEVTDLKGWYEEE
jgi:hypothetical protein